MAAPRSWPWRAVPSSGLTEAETVEAVRLAARALLSFTKTARPDWVPPPFEPWICAEALGIEITTAPGPLGLDALLIPMGEQPRIVCNSAVRSVRRRRFSIAHELSHLFFEDAEATFHLRATQRQAFYETDEARRLERFCDRGAAELLMPRDSLAGWAAPGRFRASAIARMAEAFQVSLQAAALRLLDIQHGPCAAGLFALSPPPGATRRTKAGSAGDVTYRAMRVFHGQGFPFLFPVGKSVPRESVVYACSLRCEELRGRETFELGSREVEVNVTAFPLHRNPHAITEPPLVCATFET